MYCVREGCEKQFYGIPDEEAQRPPYKCICVFVCVTLWPHPISLHWLLSHAQTKHYLLHLKEKCSGCLLVFRFTIFAPLAQIPNGSSLPTYVGGGKRVDRVFLEHRRLLREPLFRRKTVHIRGYDNWKNEVQKDMGTVLIFCCRSWRLRTAIWDFPAKTFVGVHARR